MSEIKITKQNFDEVVKNSQKPVLVDFWATWCGPCKMIEPIIEKIAEEHADTLTVGKINVDEEAELAIAYDVMSIPTLLYFENGEVTNKAIGYMTEDEILKKFGI